jgi:hypothetical protein
MMTFGYAVVMETFGNVAGHTGRTRKRLFARESQQRSDVRRAPVWRIDRADRTSPHVGNWPDRFSTWKSGAVVMMTFGNAPVPQVGDCPFERSGHEDLRQRSRGTVVMKTFGNVAGHTGRTRERLFARESQQRSDVRRAPVWPIDRADRTYTHVGDWPDRFSTWKSDREATQ